MQSGFDPPPPPPGGYPPPEGYPPQQAQPQQVPQHQQVQGQLAQNNPYAQNPYAQQQYIPPAPGYVQPMGGYGGYGYAAPTDGKATASLVLGLVSVVCFIPFTGVAAIVFGALAKRDIAKAGGALGGSGMALAGIIIGAFSTFLSIVYAGVAIATMIGAAHAVSSIPTGTYPTAYPTFPVPTAIPTPTGETAGGVVPSTVLHGNLKVVSIGSGSPLQDQLIDLRTTETALGRTVIVQTTATWCGACKEIASTMDDPKMTKALDQVTLIEVDTDEFGSELAALRMETNAIPYFFKIDSTAHATDAISGDEWDENIATNEAPVLGAFAKGTLKKRRHPSPVGTSL